MENEVQNKTSETNEGKSAKTKRTKTKPKSGEETDSQSRADRKKEFKQDASHNTSSRGVTRGRNVTIGRDRG